MWPAEMRIASRDERGVVVVMTVLLTTVILLFAAFAVDLGTKRVARQDMQSLADAVAMDLARQLKGRTASAILADPRFRQVQQQAIAQNGATTGDAPAVTPVLGIVDDRTGAFTAVSGGSIPTAVRVLASTSVGFAFAAGSGSTGREAIATASDPLVCFSVSPTALTVNTSGSSLAPLLDQILRVRLNVLNSQGLLDVRGLEVPLADIAVALGAATPQELLGLSNVSLRSFVLASAAALSKNGNTAEAAVLQAIGTQISGVYVDVATILALDTGDAAGLAASVDVFELVTGAIFAANGTNAVNVKGLALAVPGLGGVQELSATIVQPPQIACGKAGVVARGAQVRVRLRTGIDPLGIGATEVKLDLGLELGRGEGTLSSVTCGDPSSAVIRAKTGAALASGTLSLKLLLSILTVTEQVKATVAAGGPKDLTFTMPQAADPSPPQSVSGSNVLKLEPVGVVGAVASSLINGPVDLLLSTLLYPVLGLLGIKIAYTEVSVHGGIDCATVRLVG